MQAVIKWIGIALGLLVVGLVVLVLVFDWNWIKGFVEREASKALGRTVVIEGDLAVQLSWSPLVRMDHVRIANASWSPEPSMFTAQRLVFRFNLRELLRGLYDAAGEGPPTRGVVFIVGIGQRAPVATYKARTQEWLQDTAFWSDMNVYVGDWS